MGIAEYRLIEEKSFLKLENKLSSPNITSKLFSDNQHPNPYLFYFPITEIFSAIGVDAPTSALKPLNTNRNRKRLLPTITDKLQIQKNASFFCFFKLKNQVRWGGPKVIVLKNHFS
jgi:hypothetical protein